MAPVLILPRSEIASEYTWNAPSLFESAQDWEIEYQSIVEFLPKLQTFQGHLGDGATILVSALDTVEQLMRRVGKIIVYSGMESNVNAMNQDAVAMDSKGSGLFSRAISAISFVDPELLAIGQTMLNNWISNSSYLVIYKQYFDNLFRLQSHVRSDEVEEVLGNLLDPFRSTSDTMSMLTNAALVFRSAI